MDDKDRGPQIAFPLELIAVAKQTYSGRGMLSFAWFLCHLGYAAAKVKSRELLFKNHNELARLAGVARSTLDRYAYTLEELGLGTLQEHSLRLTPKGFESLIAPHLIIMAKRKDSFAEAVLDKLGCVPPGDLISEQRGLNLYTRLATEGMYLLNTEQVYTDFKLQRGSPRIEQYLNEWQGEGAWPSQVEAQPEQQSEPAYQHKLSY